MAKILVTGGAGFIGSHLVDALIKKKHSVTIIDDLSVGKKKYLNSKASFIKLKIQSKKIVEVFKKKKFDYVYHLAAQKNLQYSKDHPVQDSETNILGSLNIIDACKKFKVKKIIFYSTAAIYDAKAKPPNKETETPNPITPYGVAKRVIEKYLEISTLNYSVLRLSNVYGPRQDSEGEGGVVAIFCKELIDGKRITIYNSGNQTRDYIYVEDVVRASLVTLKKGKNLAVNVSTGVETSVNRLLKELEKTSGLIANSTKGKKIQEQKRSALSYHLAKRKLLWQPKILLEKGLFQTFNWFKN